MLILCSLPICLLFVCDDTQSSHRVSGLMMANNTAIHSLFLKSLRQYDLLRRRNAFLDGYRGRGSLFAEGLEELDDAREVAHTLVDEYRAAERPDYLDWNPDAAHGDDDDGYGQGGDGDDDGYGDDDHGDGDGDDEYEDDGTEGTHVDFPAGAGHDALGVNARLAGLALHSGGNGGPQGLSAVDMAQNRAAAAAAAPSSGAGAGSGDGRVPPSNKNPYGYDF